MTNKPKVRAIELIFLAVGSAIMFPYTFLPILSTYPKNHDVWVVFLVSIIFILILNAPLLYITNKFRGLTISQVFDAISGKIIGKIAALFYILLFFMCGISCMMLALQFLNTSLMVKTPLWALLIITLIPVTYASMKGAGVIARIAVIIVPVILITIIFFGIMGIEFMEISSIMPILSDTFFLDIIKGSFLTALRFSEISIIFVFSYFLKNSVSINKIYFKSLLVFGIFFMLILFPVLLTFGYEMASISFNPYFLYTRQVQVFNIIEKVQSINTLAWFPGILLKLAIYNFMAAFTLGQIFKKVKVPTFSLCISILTFIICIIPNIDNTMFFDFVLSDRFFPYAILFVVTVIPLLLTIVYGINKKRTDQKVAKLLEEAKNTENNDGQEPVAKKPIEEKNFN